MELTIQEQRLEVATVLYPNGIECPHRVELRWRNDRIGCWPTRGETNVTVPKCVAGMNHARRQSQTGAEQQRPSRSAG